MNNDGGAAPIADVHCDGRRQGTLTRQGPLVVLRYDPDATSEIALSLPRSVAEHPGPAPGAVPPFFAGLLPEGRRLSALRRRIKTSADNDLALLVATGGDPIGAVQVVAHGATPPDGDDAIDLSDPSSADFASVFAISTGDELDPVSLPGVQDKASARTISLPVGRQVRAILKLDPPEYPHLVVNEAVFMAAARIAGLTTADTRVIHDRQDRPGLLVTRFDRGTDASGDVQRFHQEDGCQVLGRYPADKYDIDLAEVAAALIEPCRARPVAARDLFRQIVFAYLTGNGDQHAKNLSVLQRDGEWRISPLYDAPSTYPYGDRSLGLPILGERPAHPSRKLVLEFAERIGLRSPAASKELDGLCRSVERWIDLVDTLPFDPKLRRDLRRHVEYRARLLSGE